MSKLHRVRVAQPPQTLCGRALTDGVAIASSGRTPTCAVCLRVISAPVASTVLLGIVLKPSAWVLFGSHLNCTRPGTVDLDRVSVRTPEGRTLLEEGVRAGTARWRQLRHALFERLRTAASHAAQDRGTDCIVLDGDIRDARGRPVADVTDALVVYLP